MIRLTIPNQKYRQIGSMLTKTGQIGQNQVQMELTAVPPKHNRYQAIMKLHQATKSIVSISKNDSTYTEQSQSIKLIIRSKLGSHGH